MSDTTSTFLKIVSVLLSPKSAIHVLSVGCLLLTSYSLGPNFIANYGLQIKAQSELVLTLLGLGAGSLVGSVIVRIYEIFEKSYLEKRKKKEQLEKSNLISQAAILKFELTYDDFPTETKVEFYKLASRPQKYLNTSIFFKDFTKEGYLENISKVSEESYLISMKPYLKELAKTKWERLISSRYEYEVQDEEFGVIFDILDENKNIEITNSIISTIINKHFIFDFFFDIYFENGEIVVEWVGFVQNIVEDHSGRTFKTFVRLPITDTEVFKSLETNSSI